MKMEGEIPRDPDVDPAETREWVEALDALIGAEGPERATFLLRRLLQHARARRVPLPHVLATPYVNTVGLAEQPPFQGNLEIEARLSALVRWNALAMVVRANRKEEWFHDPVGRIGVCNVPLPVRMKR